MCRLREELRVVQIAIGRVVGEVAVGLLHLAHDLRKEGPAVVQVHLERGAPALGLDRVGVVLHLIRVVEHDAGTRELHAGMLVVDVAGLLFVPAHQTHRREIGQRQIDETFDGIAHSAVGDVIHVQVVAGREGAGVRFVGDDAHGAGLGARAVQSSLRPRERLDPGDVIDVDVEIAVDGRDRLFVEIGADARQRSGVIAVAAARHAAHVGMFEARTAVLLERDARQVFCVIVEGRHVQLFQLHGAERLDAERHVLEILGAFLRGHHHLVERGQVGGVGTPGNGHAGQ